LDDIEKKLPTEIDDTEFTGSVFLENHMKGMPGPAANTW
jgi:hypothetical protein